MNKIFLLVIVSLFGTMTNAFGDSDLQSAQLQKAGVELDQIVKDLSAESAVSAASAVKDAATLVKDAAQKAAASPKDSNEWTGDHLKIRGNLYGLKQDGASNSAKVYFAPSDVRFDVSEDKNDVIRMTPRANFKIKITLAASAVPAVVTVSPSAKHNWYGNIALLKKDATSEDVSVPAGYQPIEPHESYTINKREIEKIPYVKYGWTYGALIVPFKYQRNFKTIKAAPSYQMYVGYKRDSNGKAEGPFISAGLTSADIPTGDGTSSTKQGFSYGLGWIFEIKKSAGIQLLLMVGEDRFGKDSGYLHEGKTWYSMSLGFSLDPQTTK